MCNAFHFTILAMVCSQPIEMILFFNLQLLKTSDASALRQNPQWDTHFLPSGRCPFKQNKQTELREIPTHCVKNRLIHRNLWKILLFVMLKLNSAIKTTFFSSPKWISKFNNFFEFWNSSAHFGVFNERNQTTFDDIH